MPQSRTYCVCVQYETQVLHTNGITECTNYWALSFLLKADSLFSFLSKQLSCFMNPAMSSSGEPELSWQTNTSSLLLLCFHASSSAYCSGDSDTKRHEERGPGVDKQRMPSHVTPAWTDALAGNWGSWREAGRHKHTHMDKATTHTRTHTYIHKGMSPVIAFHLSLTCLGQAIAFRCPV